MITVCALCRATSHWTVDDRFAYFGLAAVVFAVSALMHLAMVVCSVWNDGRSFGLALQHDVYAREDGIINY